MEPNLLAEVPNYSPNNATPLEHTNISQEIYRSQLFTTNISINPLIAAADPLLIIAATLQTVEYPKDRNKLLLDLAHEIRAFASQAKVNGYQASIITAARYVLCSLLDEIIGWENDNLLNTFFHETSGGIRFFTIIDRSLENIPENLHLIELLFLCLHFGFQGKYRNTEHGANELSAITHRLYQIISQQRNDSSKKLLVTTVTAIPTTKISRQIPGTKSSWVISLIAGIALIISGSIYSMFFVQTKTASKAVYPLIEQTINFQPKTEQQ